MTKRENLRGVALGHTPTRRQLIARGAMALGGLATAAAAGAQQPSTAAAGPIIISGAIHQEVDFTVAPHRIYEALLDAKQFSAFTGVPAEIHREAGGAINCFGGRVLGRNIELIPDQRIVQAWRVNTWPEGLYSIVRFELKAQVSGTRLSFDHTGFADKDREHLNEGWPRMYWEPLRKYLG